MHACACFAGSSLIVKPLLGPGCCSGVMTAARPRLRRLSWVPAPLRSLNAPEEGTAAQLILRPLLRLVGSGGRWGLRGDEGGEGATGGSGTAGGAEGYPRDTREGCSGGGGGELRRLKVMLPDRTPLQLHDCSAFAAAAQLTGLQLCGHASAEAVQQVSPRLLTTAPHRRHHSPRQSCCQSYHPRGDSCGTHAMGYHSSVLSVKILSRQAS